MIFALPFVYGGVVTNYYHFYRQFSYSASIHDNSRRTIIPVFPMTFKTGTANRTNQRKIYENLGRITSSESSRTKRPFCVCRASQAGCASSTLESAHRAANVQETLDSNKAGALSWQSRLES